MLCHKCGENIEQGDACIAEPLEFGRYHYFHPGCHTEKPVQPRPRPLTRDEVRRMLGPYPPGLERR